MNPITEAYLSSVNEAVKYLVILVTKQKEFLIVENTSWRRYLHQLSTLAPVFEGTGDVDVMIQMLSDMSISQLKASGYIEKKNMKLMLELI